MANARIERLTSWWDDHQVALYLLAIAGGAALGLTFTGSGPVLERLVTPSLGLLLFATFLGVPMRQVGRGLRDLRFLGAVIAANFVVVPVIVFGLSRLVVESNGLRLGVLLVLLTPCIDYVIVFTGLAGGARDRLLAATPVLMLLQIVLLPLYMYLFVGSDGLAVIEVRPFVAAFVGLIVVPLLLAGGVQMVGRRHRVGRRTETVMAASMVPLMMLTLAVVVGSQVEKVQDHPVELLRLVPIYVAFAILAATVGWFIAPRIGLDVPASRSVIFSTVTRNSLVVLPIALALPPALDLAPLAVVDQTLVELVVLVAMVRIVPRLSLGPA